MGKERSIRSVINYMQVDRSSQRCRVGNFAEGGNASLVQRLLGSVSTKSVWVVSSRIGAKWEVWALEGVAVGHATVLLLDIGHLAG